MNATEKELSEVEEEKELARATSRGWELLSDLEGKCLYFVSGWWSYSFCHNREVRQFHQLPPQQNNQWPPTEDPDTQSYVLGQVSADADGSRNPGEGTELQATGELRYLVQKLGGGTICDLTGKERKIEVQVCVDSMTVGYI
jgi:protein OS-9